MSEKIVWENAFEQKKKKTWLNLSANRPSNNWAQDSIVPSTLRVVATKSN